MVDSELERCPVFENGSDGCSEVGRSLLLAHCTETFPVSAKQACFKDILNSLSQNFLLSITVEKFQVSHI